MGGGAAHAGGPRGGRRRPPGRPAVRLPGRPYLPGPVGRHNLAPPHHGERLSRPCPQGRLPQNLARRRHQPVRAAPGPPRVGRGPRRAPGPPPAGPRGSRADPRGPARRTRPRRHAGIPGRGGGTYPRRSHRNREKPLRAGAVTTAADGHSSARRHSG
ncbi:hypothetical protein BN2537_8739 [Streptomyces venezuelae]|nr:hypothetical protein BN2537_8739 [Streptomyces venezuelae]